MEVSMDENSRTTAEGAADEGTGSGRFGRAKEFMGGKYNSMRERVEDVDFGAMVDGVRTYVRSNPGKALLISVGVGFLVGLLLRSDEDED
jgi:ElaB/YqjD/DUF883 family membrane-anchored ribosome-binding protein